MSLLLLGSCRGHDDGGHARFCEEVDKVDGRWSYALAIADDDWATEFSSVAPDELADTVEALTSDLPLYAPSDKVTTAVATINAWATTNCGSS